MSSWIVGRRRKAGQSAIRLLNSSHSSFSIHRFCGQIAIGSTGHMPRVKVQTCFSSLFFLSGGAWELCLSQKANILISKIERQVSKIGFMSKTSMSELGLMKKTCINFAKKIVTYSNLIENRYLLVRCVWYTKPKHICCIRFFLCSSIVLTIFLTYSSLIENFYLLVRCVWYVEP